VLLQLHGLAQAGPRKGSLPDAPRLGSRGGQREDDPACVPAARPKRNLQRLARANNRVDRFLREGRMLRIASAASRQSPSPVSMMMHGRCPCPRAA